MHSKLIEIVDMKKREVEELKKTGLPFVEDGAKNPIRDFKGAVSRPGGINLIAEIKFASPSAGTIREMSDPVVLGRIYERSGAAAISLLTDKSFFNGDLENLPILKKSVSLPILRKDFIIDEIQVRESALYGADALLLIAKILSVKQLKTLLGVCRELDLFALTEIHDRNDLERALESDAEIIGINNRNLDTFEIDLQTTHDLVHLIPDDRVVVSESGIHSGHDIIALKRGPINAVLVGSSIMGSDDIEGKIQELVEAGR